jgi:hypothetical protein
VTREDPAEQGVLSGLEELLMRGSQAALEKNRKV